MGFNDEQKKAIEVSAQKDVLITAGAGSGKTNTLAERVFRLINDGIVKPSSLLVLTFTNNSAHDMKSKILKRFGPNDPHYQEMLSAHIQSFDSFNAYLVRSYAGELGVAPSFGVMPETLFAQKQTLFVDEALNEAYADPAKRKDIVAFLSLFGFKNDKKLKSSVLDILKQINRFSPSKRAQFLKDYQTRFLSRSFAERLYHDVCEKQRELIRDVLWEAYIVDQLSGLLVPADSIDPSKFASALSAPSLFNKPLATLSISPDSDAPEDFLNKEFRELAAMLDLDDEELVEESAKFLENNGKTYYAGTCKGLKKSGLNSCSYHEPVFKTLKKTKPMIAGLASLGTIDEEFAKLSRYSPATKVLFDLALAVQDKLDAYRAEHNTYTFSDITALALSLFTDSQYEPIAEALRSRFTYVMVDEYQDTNDSQEIFLEGLLKPNAKGERSHLFCVGDAKQSIYAFRASNVALFRDRQKRYAQAGNAAAEVIAMNKNYRSAQRLLQHINHIFTCYMTLDMGGTDYHDRMERLTYDAKTNLYNVDLPGYGVHRILPPDSFRYYPKKNFLREERNDAEYEAKAILADIKEKIAQGFLVFDRGGKTTKVRPCKPSDFCILLRKRGSVSLYQKLFNENDMPLNNRVKVNLREVNAIILIQSLLSLVSYVAGDTTIDVPHVFASVARSYIGDYDDTELHAILTAGSVGGPQVLDAINREPLMEDIRDFYAHYADAPFHSLFLAMLERFHVIDRLYLVGDIEDNVSKIESLYALILAEEAVGDGLKEFVALVRDIDKHQLDISSESAQESAEAVDLMTIHGSKGLERKIVYLPSSGNGVGRGDTRKKPPYDFSESTGVSFPCVDVDGLSDDEKREIANLIKRRNDLLDEDDEIQEHVRLLYVALTRAENAVYVVGRKKEKTSSVYVMFEDVPSFLQINPQALSLVSHATKQRYLDSLALTHPPMLDESLIPAETWVAYKDLYDTYVRSFLEKEKEDAVYGVLSELYDYLRDQFLQKALTEDELAAIYGAVFFPSKAKTMPIKDFASLLAAFQSEEGTDEDEEEEDASGEDDDVPEEEEGEDNDSGQTSIGLMDEERLRKILQDFRQGIMDGNTDLTFPFTKRKKEMTPEELKKFFIDALLTALAAFYANLEYVVYESYKAPDYEDRVTFFDAASFQGATGSKVPTLPKMTIDDTPIPFPARLKTRASKKVEDDKELPSPELLERGNRLHRYMELLDFKTLDLSFIKDESERKIIAKAIETPIMKMAFSADEVYREYGYFDVEQQNTGYVDLFFIKDGVLHIVDYKSSRISDPAYDTQLKLYAHNLARLFHKDEKSIKMHLLSLSQAKTRDVE